MVSKSAIYNFSEGMGFLSRMLMPTGGKIVFKIESIGERSFLAHAASSLRGRGVWDKPDGTWLHR